MFRRFAVLALVAILAAPPALADEIAPRIVVGATGEVAVVPDMATLRLTVLRDGETARTALDAANEAARAVIAALKAQGIAERDLQTSGLMVQPQYAYPQPTERPAAPRITGYQVTNTITARLRDLTKVGAVIDEAVTLGVNQGGDIVFGNADPRPALAEARKRAVQEARAKAEVLAAAAGVALGDVREISETAGIAQPMPIDAKVLRMEAADTVPVEAGENTYRVDVQVIWDIGRN